MRLLVEIIFSLVTLVPSNTIVFR
ncbi:rCG37624 [Rattus norvegicus]|uniref:RCG37624 n=1 Tax=Rattus norvegicus TaxID=10116 RepID=A6K817_RAT|nr:rCG37624 [Rattus norvegicus]